jgi:hypothetical protein
MTKTLGRGSTRSQKSLYIFAAVALLASLMTMYLPLPAQADHIPETGAVPDNCVKIEGNDLGQEGLVVNVDGVSVTFTNWVLKPGESGEYTAVDLTVSGLPADKTLDWQLKAGGGADEGSITEDGTYTAQVSGQQAISHITVCLFDEPQPEPGTIIVEKQVTAGSDTTTVFTFTESGFSLDDNTLADGESGSASVAAGGDYSVSESVPAGWSLQSATCDDADSTPQDINVSEGETVTCTFVNQENPPEPEPGEIIVVKEVIAGGSTSFEFTFDTTGFALADNTLAHGQSSSSGDLPAGQGYGVAEDVPAGWTLVSATCDDGSDPSDIGLSSGETVTCTFTNEVIPEVQASVFVTVSGSCQVVGSEGEGRITVDISVDDAATVVIEDADGAVLGTFTEDGTLTVPEGATYSWEATPSEGFEFPAGFDAAGEVTITTCSVLPFTGIESEHLALIATMLLLAGGAAVLASRRMGGAVSA